MGRLIDADNLEKKLLELCGNKPPMFYYFSKAIKVIREQPTAYDVDKVMNQIERERVNAFLTLANTGDSKYDFGWEKVSRYLDIAEEIIKGGGKDE